ncbi:MAG: RagB/SusD family nutrient uptake outer membrane protein [Prevotellaceae bacterium]|nr:RagB/SusD family nutrient uptake outer membrane protein [Prevotellaceae bacterium]
MAKLLVLLVVALSQVSCNEYLDILPKGQKIPTTLADFEAMLRYEYGVHRVDAGNAINLLNDSYQTVANLNYSSLTKANYMWDESADRIYLNNSGEGMYYDSYVSISTCNLIIEHAPEATECTDAERAEVIACAKALRAMNYFNLVNYYADTYDAATASAKNAVPWITSADVNAPHQQLTIQGIYDHILNDVKEALPNLPATSPTPLHPNRGAAYAFYARVYLQMGDYPQALEYAELALAENDALYDWTAYYEENKTQIENPDSYTVTPSPAGHYYVENYIFRHGLTSYQYVGRSIPVERKARFEDGDARAAARWKVRTVGTDTYCVSTTTGFFNESGITTTEVYLIKAECLARDGKYSEAMAALNTVREKRILAAKYTALSASTEEEAIEYIRRTKDNELLGTLIPFADARRYNLDPKYARTLTKVVDGTTYTLSPTSHLWTMPFPQGAIKNPGNGTITQNVNK